MPGDLPCEKHCESRWCRWCQDGHCMDNDTCENQSGQAPSYWSHVDGSDSSPNNENEKEEEE